MKKTKNHRKKSPEAPPAPAREEEFPEGVYRVRGAMMSDIQISRPPFELRTPRAPRNKSPAHGG